MPRLGTAQECITSFDPVVKSIGLSVGIATSAVVRSLRIVPTSAGISAEASRGRAWLTVGFGITELLELPASKVTQLTRGEAPETPGLRESAQRLSRRSRELK